MFNNTEPTLSNVTGDQKQRDQSEGETEDEAPGRTIKVINETKSEKCAKNCRRNN